MQQPPILPCPHWSGTSFLAIFASLVALPLLSFGKADPTLRTNISLDVYNRDQALVREVRRVDLVKGEGAADFCRIATDIFGYTARIRPLEKERLIATRSLSYNYDLVSQEKLLERYLGQWFSFSTEEADYVGRLLRFDSTHLFLQPDTLGLVIQVVERGKLKEMYYPAIPEGLFLEPTLRWEYVSEKELEDLPVEISYLTTDINWTCDYRAELLGEDSLELSGNFTLDNQLPLDFPDAKITLVAGWPHRAEDPREGGGDALNAPTLPSRDDSRLFEYHRYPLPKTLTLRHSQTIQVPYFIPRRIKVERRFVCPHILDGEEVRVKLSFLNVSASGAGFSMPEGDVGLYKRDHDGSLAFLGEDHTVAVPEGEKVDLDVGVAFDLGVKRIRVAQARPERDRHQETWRIELTSGRESESTVEVEQRVFGYYTVENPQVNELSASYRTESAGRLIFPVNIAPHGKSVLTFALIYGY